MRRSVGTLLVAGTILASACSDSTSPTPPLDGHWNITAYENDGVAASAVSGTADFSANGTATFIGLITFPGEPQDTVNSTFAWSQNGDRLTLTDAVDSSEWSITFGANAATVVLALLNDASASRLTLAR